MAVGGGTVAAVGYAMVINMMATVRFGRSALGFVFAAINQLTLVWCWCLPCILYIGLKDLAKQGGVAGGGSW